MRLLMILAMLSVMPALGCGGDASSSCVEDSQCPTGQACNRSGASGYCAALCTNTGHCPDRVDCPSEKKIPNSASCIDEGRHKGQGVCDLYVGDFTPATCGDAVVACKTDKEGDGCSCSAAPAAGDRSSCTAKDFAPAVCCAGDGFCMCDRYGCKQEIYGCSCSPYGDADDKVLQSCEPQGFKCCQSDYDCTCYNYAKQCDAGDREVSSCTAQGFACGELAPRRVDRCDQLQ